MLVPVSSNAQNSNLKPELLMPVDYQRALEIVKAHINNPEYESVSAWYDVGRHSRFNFDAIRETYKAEEAKLTFSHYEYGRNLVTQFIRYEHHDIYLHKPEVLTRNLVLGKHEFPAAAVQVLNSGNIAYAGIFFDTRQAQVREEFIPELEKLGFTCWKASEPYEGTREGPLKSIFTIEECFGPGAREWMEEYKKGTGPECLIINR